MPQRLFAIAFGAALAALGSLPSPALADDAEVARGRYLVIIAGCSDCHTPGALIGAPDMKRYLGGSDVGFSIPGQGVFVGENLTPDKETGIGSWTSDEIITAIRKASGRTAAN
jgi:mono/diheme cytochrome c family protein